MSGRTSVDDLLARIYQLYPRGLWPSEEYDATAESRRLAIARQEAAAEYPRWQAMIDKVVTRAPDVKVQDGSFHLFSSPGCDGCYSARMWLTESTWSPAKQERYVGFMVSFVVSYYVIYSGWTTPTELVGPGVQSKQERRMEVRGDAETVPIVSSDHRIDSGDSKRSACGRTYPVVYVNTPSTASKPSGLPPRHEICFDPATDEEPYAQLITQEIKAAYPDYELMPEDVGRVLVPNIVAGGGGPGESTIFDCLFSHIM